ncbi:uncharacterized protein LY79DRAFT_311399 [Colletotrichum navitas]|uniref:Uncharacterized protein n=1 Tax=Colletotrichum navitas TaxID=681940 RepID=A0AAD8PU99_9PEZI|nr:uncharacterized protein LY79DRAFT_311399 [Colletotrichum navitas]KAK1580199.1 hypothetical protein LY79DRAFT_311399 [Colletotrichum navitas]
MCMRVLYTRVSVSIRREGVCLHVGVCVRVSLRNEQPLKAQLQPRLHPKAHRSSCAVIYECDTDSQSLKLRRTQDKKKGASMCCDAPRRQTSPRPLLGGVAAAVDPPRPPRQAPWLSLTAPLLHRDTVVSTPGQRQRGNEFYSPSSRQLSRRRAGR